MMTVVWMSAAFFIGFLVLFLFAACKVSSEADHKANYMEEYAEDLDAEDDDPDQ